MLDLRKYACTYSGENMEEENVPMDVAVGVKKEYIFVWSDETTSNKGEHRRKQIVHEDTGHGLRPPPKRGGEPIMISGFVSEKCGPLKLTDKRIKEILEKDPEHPCKNWSKEQRDASVYFKYGKNNEGWWDSLKQLDQVVNKV